MSICGPAPGLEAYDGIMPLNASSASTAFGECCMETRTSLTKMTSLFYNEQPIVDGDTPRGLGMSVGDVINARKC